MRLPSLFLAGFLLLSVFCCYSVSADVTISSDYVYSVGNQNFSVDSGTMNFSHVLWNSSDITFNNTNFNISSGNHINISLVTLSDNVGGASINDNVLSFKANTSSGIVWFNISGFEKNQSYDVRRDNVLLSSTTSDGFGVVSFSSNVWSEHEFDFYEDNQLVHVNYDSGNLNVITEGWDSSIILILTLILILILSMIIISIYLLKGGKT